ncbi:UAA transporter [Hygrophoropsis aurantiaca]|uniref:UAA transporter n=1 Tax=Hygrophoropsis aurantiaca TaxID=72124 RepID=A0ACB8AIT4_9AGAM|nr:UAA transporter [Hygrophoropsis aurantiaca]
MLSLSDWITTLTLVFGGCCSNAITLERITSEYPQSGVLITFFQFLIVSLYSLPKQFTFSEPPSHIENVEGSKARPSQSKLVKKTWLPRLKQRRVPLLPYFIQVALFFVLSTLNNAAFAYHIPMTVHIIFRSGGMIVNMFLGWMLAKKRYTPRQVISVIIVTIGIVSSTLSASKRKSHSSDAQSTEVSLYATGIAILSLALVLSGFLGLIQDWVFAHYIKPAETKTSSTDQGSSWQENMFYLHSLALPLFYFSKDSITTEFGRIASGPATPLAYSPFTPTISIPAACIHLFVNTCTQLLCVIGVNRLTGRVSSLTVTLILTVRKAVSLLLSVAVYGGQGHIMMWAGAALVFLGTIGYSTSKPIQTPKKKVE